MSKYVSWCGLAVLCTTVGCKTFTQKVGWETSGVTLPHYALRLPGKPNVTKTLHRPEPETRSVETSEKPLVTREKPVEPLGLPEKTDVSEDWGIFAALVEAGAVSKAALTGACEKVSSVMTVPQTILSALKPAAVEKVEQQATRTADESAVDAKQTMSQPMWNRVWYAIAPLLSALGAYVLAPLFVDFLKQRFGQTRRGQGKKEPTLV